MKRKHSKKKSAKAPDKKTPAPSKKVPTWIGKLEECAHELNLGSRRIQQLAKEGLPKADRGVYDIIECFRFYVRYLQRKLVERALPEDGDGDGGAPATSAAAKRHEMLTVELESKKLDLAERREQLISIEKATKDMSALVVEIRTRILALPPRLAAEVLGETDLAIAQVKIDRSLKGALECLSQYDPDDDSDSRVVPAS